MQNRLNIVSSSHVWLIGFGRYAPGARRKDAWLWPRYQCSQSWPQLGSCQLAAVARTWRRKPVRSSTSIVFIVALSQKAGSVVESLVLPDVHVAVAAP